MNRKDIFFYDQEEIIIEKMEDDAIIPVYQTDGASGADLAAYTPNEDIYITPGAMVWISTKIKIEIPLGLEGQVRSRSGLACKYGIVVINSPGTVDSDYRGELKVVLKNMGEDTFIVTHGMRVAQICFQRIERVRFVMGELSITSRGEGGFGHTGLVTFVGEQNEYGVS